MAQSTRETTLRKFKSGDIKLLVATDVAGRGIDVESLSHVFNFDVPLHAEDYVHRIGRTGRAGKEGSAFTLVCPDDLKYVDSIIKLIGHDIPKQALSDYLDAPSLNPSEKNKPHQDDNNRKHVPNIKSSKPVRIKKSVAPTNKSRSANAVKTDKGTSNHNWTGPVPAFLKMKNTILPN